MSLWHGQSTLVMYGSNISMNSMNLGKWERLERRQRRWCSGINLRRWLTGSGASDVVDLLRQERGKSNNSISCGRTVDLDLRITMQRSRLPVSLAHGLQVRLAVFVFRSHFVQSRRGRYTKYRLSALESLWESCLVAVQRSLCQISAESIQKHLTDNHRSHFHVSSSY